MFRFVPSLTPASLRRLGLVVLACSAMALAGCGGGSRAKDYAPSRMVSFGDENSAFSDITVKDEGGNDVTLTGLAYSVNSSVILSSVLICHYQTATAPVVPTACDTSTGTSLSDLSSSVTFATASPPEFRAYRLSTDHDSHNSPDPRVVTIYEKGTDASTSNPVMGDLQRYWKRTYLCSASNNWVAYVAGAFGFSFRNSCNTAGNGAVSYAADGDKVADIVAKVSAHRGELGDGVLVTLMGGQNDIVEMYRAVHGGADGTNPSPSMTEDQATAQLQARAGQLAGAVGTIFNSGAKVIVALTPDLGQSPLAVTENSSGLLGRLTKAFNDSFYIENVARNYNDGRKVAGVNTYYITDPANRSTAYVYGTQVCDANRAVPFASPASGPTSASSKLLYCASDTLATGASVSTYIWADDRHFAPAGHVQIGSAAYNRAANQF